MSSPTLGVWSTVRRVTELGHSPMRTLREIIPTTTQLATLNRRSKNDNRSARSSAPRKRRGLCYRCGLPYTRIKVLRRPGRAGIGRSTENEHQSGCDLPIAQHHWISQVFRKGRTLDGHWEEFRDAGPPFEMIPSAPALCECAILTESALVLLEYHEGIHIQQFCRFKLSPGLGATALADFGHATTVTSSVSGRPSPEEGDFADVHPGSPRWHRLSLTVFARMHVYRGPRQASPRTLNYILQLQLMVGERYRQSEICDLARIEVVRVCGRMLWPTVAAQRLHVNAEGCQGCSTRCKLQTPWRLSCRHRARGTWQEGCT